MGPWPNAETSRINRWWFEDTDARRHTIELVREHWKCAEDRGTLTRSERARLNLADTIKDRVAGDAAKCGGPPSVFNDLLACAINRVDWMHLADAWLDTEELNGYEGL